MEKLNLDDVVEYVGNNIEIFHYKRIASLERLELKTVLRKKNPYLFKAKYLMTGDEIVRALVNAFISSTEETIFGNWLEGLAIFINSKVYNGVKSGIEGIDLEFNKNGVRNIVTIKSGPNWGNSAQINKMKSAFVKAKKILHTSDSNLQVCCINGCCYGRDNNPFKGDYYKYCGQAFWEFISGEADLYLKIIEPLGNKAKEQNDKYQILYSQQINKFVKEFLFDFCKDDYSVDWDKLVRFNSAK